MYGLSVSVFSKLLSNLRSGSQMLIVNCVTEFSMIQSASVYVYKSQSSLFVLYFRESSICQFFPNILE
ncbi:unnamed protein product [Schistosoma margrebowiei]|uniref:Uncharacterized protein n=1 Tax=Schistosoma margrebowiei TaxID=48269 RepID=A0A3P8DVS3_9TREM|nr:unnamed protein product [Schistosoma margrebowiei]